MKTYDEFLFYLMYIIHMPESIARDYCRWLVNNGYLKEGDKNV